MTLEAKQIELLQAELTRVGHFMRELADTQRKGSVKNLMWLKTKRHAERALKASRALFSELEAMRDLD